ncbi:hypothetical protein OHA91_39700 (plasmid) [Streptomyces erythrochromogenes]|uniref:Uncharacterized protein n=1 Tax=Streptomyces erythrochromogenes TaxID=285574 RepID=A0ABZ1QPE4_9ACTN|nr:hypothetical protein [Streptomyces erythrochromogenes]
MARQATGVAVSAETEVLLRVWVDGGIDLHDTTTASTASGDPRAVTTY